MTPPHVRLTRLAEDEQIVLWGLLAQCEYGMVARHSSGRISTEITDDGLVAASLLQVLALSVLRSLGLVEYAPADEFGDRYLVTTELGSVVLGMLDAKFAGGAL